MQVEQITNASQDLNSQWNFSIKQIQIGNVTCSMKIAIVSRNFATLQIEFHFAMMI
jgi:hypothetical protein